jgi:hypothetical protein
MARHVAVENLARILDRLVDVDLQLDPVCGTNQATLAARASDSVIEARVLLRKTIGDLRNAIHQLDGAKHALVDGARTPENVPRTADGKRTGSAYQDGHGSEPPLGAV